MNELFASIDLGGTNLKGALGDQQGNVVVAKSVSTGSHEGPDGVLDRIARLVEDLSTEAEAKPLAVGMGVPGLVDLQRGLTKFLPNLPTQWRDVPVRDILEPRVGCPVYILNDVRTATLGELVFGFGQDVSSFVFFAIGTGIGGGVVLDGRLRLGPLGAAGELGHQTVLPDGPPCGCGNRGCLETVASGPALAAAGVRLVRNGLAPKLHEITEGDLNRVTPETIAEAAEAGELIVLHEIDRFAEFLGIGASNMITALHPEMVVFGGGVAQMGQLLVERIRQTILERVKMIPPEEIAVEISKLGDRAGTLGGIALAMKGGHLGDRTGG